MAKKVKSTRRAGRNRTRVSSKHQVTIPARAFHSAGFRPGDTVQVEARGAGQVVLTRVEELMDSYAGALDSGGRMREELEALREEWR
jgi:bifunctional DNA-binding transcriptional regulator/antitoxin component of YhaV-PrlF toxin-antitoxin module